MYLPLLCYFEKVLIKILSLIVFYPFEIKSLNWREILCDWVQVIFLPFLLASLHYKRDYHSALLRHLQFSTFTTHFELHTLTHTTAFKTCIPSCSFLYCCSLLLLIISWVKVKANILLLLCLCILLLLFYWYVLIQSLAIILMCLLRTPTSMPTTCNVWHVHMLLFALHSCECLIPILLPSMSL